MIAPGPSFSSLSLSGVQAQSQAEGERELHCIVNPHPNKCVATSQVETRDFILADLPLSSF